MNHNRKNIRFLIIILFSLNTFNLHEAQTKIISAFPNLSFSKPIDIQHPNDNTDRLFIVSQRGIIHVVETIDEVSNSTIFLEINDKVIFGGEQGLLGLVFDPDYSSNGYFYVNYTANNPRRTIISRFSVSNANRNQAELLSELKLLEVEQPYENHNGGQIAFGPDGYLYISFGDGGSRGDPGNRAQNLSTLLGKMVRIDVSQSTKVNLYQIPEDNPFYGNNENLREEIFAYGLRNVWRFSFDGNGNLWAADVGQGEWEEISLIQNGGNYGWKIMEGSYCYNPQNNCNQDGLILPVWEYDHSSQGGYSITGGYYYEGNNVPELFNKYVYADFVTGNIWAFNPQDNSNSFLEKFDGEISTFGIDMNKELYFADYKSGLIYKFVDDNVSSVNNFVPKRIMLNQNYPNPFNPNTKIGYTIQGKTGIEFSDVSLVQLRIFDVLGNEIATLVNEIQKPGEYEVEFNGNSGADRKLATGVYYYQLKFGEIIETKKMLMIK